MRMAQENASIQKNHRWFVNHTAMRTQHNLHATAKGHKKVSKRLETSQFGFHWQNQNDMRSIKTISILKFTFIQNITNHWNTRRVGLHIRFCWYQVASNKENYLIDSTKLYATPSGLIWKVMIHNCPGGLFRMISIKMIFISMRKLLRRTCWLYSKPLSVLEHSETF